MSENDKSDNKSPAAPTNPLDKQLDAENVDEALTELESYCVNCSQNGVTKLLLTSIPYFKSVIISSFSCPHCSYQNNELQSAQEIEKYGIQLILKMHDKTTASSSEEVNADLNRQVIFSEYATIEIPELELEMLARHHKGDITTVEGILQRTIDGLSQDQPRRQLENPNDYEQVAKFIFKTESYKSGEKAFMLKIRDPSGNSFISPRSSTNLGQLDPQLTIEKFVRTVEENRDLGIFSANDLNVDNLTINEEDENAAATTDEANETTTSNIHNNDQEQLEYEVHSFSMPCPNCSSKDCETKMRPTKIPHFKEVIVMATLCESCGYRTNEIKSGSGIEPKGKRYILEVRNADDFSRDILKSETCSLEIPKLEFHVGARSVTSKFTTLEGLLKDSRENLTDKNPFLLSTDSSDNSVKEKFKQFNNNFDELLLCKEPFTVILDDPAGNSYIQNLCAPNDDPQLKIEEYERSFDDNEALGLNDMKTENYEEDHNEEKTNQNTS